MLISFPVLATPATVFSVQSEFMNKKTDYIAVFDSGVGGISVLRELVKHMPGERFLYFGDSANAPYGTRTLEQIRALTLEAAQKLVRQPIKALVVACNTATSAAIDLLRSTYPELIIVGIEPALKVAADRFSKGRVGVMATPATLKQEKFARQAERFAELELLPIPLPELVELVEAGKGDSDEAEQYLRRQLAPFVGKLDAVVLGCTHYPFAAARIAKVLGEDVVICDGSEGTARQTRRRLEQAGLLNDDCAQVRIENSCNTPQMLQLCMKLLEQ